MDDGLNKDQQSISSYRIRIDAIDKDIVRLLNLRASLGEAIGKIKSKNGLPVLSSDREQQILDNIAMYNSGPLSDKSLENIYTAIMEETRKLESGLSDLKVREE
jgi:chorismate mutase